MRARFDQPRDTEGQSVVILTSVVEEEGDQFVSFCTELGTASCGDRPWTTCKRPYVCICVRWNRRANGSVCSKKEASMALKFDRAILSISPA